LWKKPTGAIHLEGKTIKQGYAWRPIPEMNYFQHNNNLTRYYRVLALGEN